MKHLQAHALEPVIREVIARGTPYLGICMGMQALLTASFEGRGASLSRRSAR